VERVKAIKTSFVSDTTLLKFLKGCGVAIKGLFSEHINPTGNSIKGGKGQGHQNKFCVGYHPFKVLKGKTRKKACKNADIPDSREMLLATAHV